MIATGIHRGLQSGAAPLRGVLTVAALGSLGTGVFWHAIAFVAKHGYGFGQKRALLLALCMGAAYALGAFRAARLARWCGRWISPRTLLAIIITSQAAFCTAPVLVEAEWALWLSAGGVTAASSIMWPLIESYVVAGRHGADMRRAVGWFNIVWMSAVALPLFLMPPILEHHAPWSIGAMTVVHLATLIPLLVAFTPHPAHHDPGLAEANVPTEYASLLRSARVLLPLSYVLGSAMSPVLPFRFEAIGAPVAAETPVTATWMVARIVALLVLWRSEFWHGRWGTLVVAGLGMTAGFGLIVLASSLWGMVAGFALFGVGVGVAYHAALYYAMAVGRAAVDAGGTHEGLIGSGYALGPAAALVGTALGGGAAIVAIVWGLVGVSALPAIYPYRLARAARRRPPARPAR